MKTRNNNQQLIDFFGHKILNMGSINEVKPRIGFVETRSKYNNMNSLRSTWINSCIAIGVPMLVKCSLYGGTIEEYSFYTLDDLKNVGKATFTQEDGAGGVAYRLYPVAANLLGSIEVNKIIANNTLLDINSISYSYTGEDLIYNYKNQQAMNAVQNAIPGAIETLTGSSGECLPPATNDSNTMNAIEGHVYYQHFGANNLHIIGVSQRGCIAARLKDGSFCYGISFCSFQDNYNKTKARELALERLEAGFACIEAKEFFKANDAKNPVIKFLAHLSNTLFFDQEKWKRKIEYFENPEALERDKDFKRKRLQKLLEAI